MPTTLEALVPAELVITYVLVNALHPAPRNARRHTKKQIRKLATAIGRYGFRVPILARRDGMIIAGHCRHAAATLIGMESVPVIYVEDLSEADLRLFAISENQLGDLSHFSTDDLKLEFAELAALNPDLDFTTAGFDAGHIDVLLEDQDDRAPEVADPPLGSIDREKPPVSRLGDIWIIGCHRVACGDALDRTVYVALLDGELAQLIVCDPPFNVRIKGHVSSSDHHAEFAMAAGEMGSEEFTTFLAEAGGHLKAFSGDGSIHFIFMDFRHFAELLAATDRNGWALMNLCVWVKSNAGMGSLYRSQHELVGVFKSGKAAHVNNVELGKHGRNRTNVWRYPGMSSFGKGRDEALAMHPTVKPINLVADAIRDCSERGKIVLDAFLGSGTTILAAEKTGRRGYGIELDPYYVDLAVERIAKACGQVGVLSETGERFDVVRERRALERSKSNLEPNAGWGTIGHE